MKKKTRVGWAIASDEYKIAFEAPEKLHIQKDQSPNQKGFLSCPSVRSFAQSFYIVKSPYSIKLRAIDDGENINIFPVYPFTSIHDTLIKKLIMIEHPSTWRKSNTITIQVPSPYVFFSDQLVLMEQSQPMLTNQTKLNWRVIPGMIDIYSWQRPLNWAFEWDLTTGDFILHNNEPIYALRFFDGNKHLNNIDLVEYPMSQKLKQQLTLTNGIAKVKKGLMPYFEKAKQKRKKLKLL